MSHPSASAAAADPTQPNTPRTESTIIISPRQRPRPQPDADPPQLLGMTSEADAPVVTNDTDDSATSNGVSSNSNDGVASIAAAPNTAAAPTMDPQRDSTTETATVTPPRRSIGNARKRSFRKTLNSDIPVEETLTLLQKVDEKTNLFREFVPSDLDYLSRVLTVLTFSPGDPIIEVGEESSFVGFVLQGDLRVQVDTESKVIPAGSLLGELSFWEGGTRTAAVHAQSEAIVAMITHNELESLAECAPTIRLKLMILFAVEGMKKMRQFAKPTVVTKNEEEKTSSASAVPTAVAATTPNERKVSHRMSGKLSPNTSHALMPSETSPSAPTSRRGTLRRTTSHVSSSPSASLIDTATAHAQSSGNNGTSASASTTRQIETLFRLRMQHQQRESQEAIERALLERKKAERRAQNTSVIADGFKMRLDKQQQELDELLAENHELKEYKNWATKKFASEAKFLQTKLDELTEAKLQAGLERNQREALERRNEELYAELDTKIHDRTEELTKQNDQLQLELQAMKARVEEVQAAWGDLESKMDTLLKQKETLESSLANTTKNHENERLAIQQLMHDQIQQVSRSLSNTSEECERLRRALNEGDEAFHQLRKVKDQAVQRSLHKDILLEKVQDHLKSIIGRQYELRKDIAHLKTILKHLLASCLTKLYRRRQLAFSIQGEIAELVEKLQLAEKEHQSRPALGTFSVDRSGGRSNMELHNVMSPIVTDGFDENSDHPSLSISTISAHARSLFAVAPRSSHSGQRTSRRPNPDDILNSVTFLLLPLRQMVEDLIARHGQYRQTAEAFCHRTIEMRSIIMRMEKRTGIKVKDKAWQGVNDALEEIGVNPPSNDMDDDVVVGDVPHMMYHDVESKEASYEHSPRSSPVPPREHHDVRKLSHSSVTSPPLTASLRGGRFFATEQQIHSTLTADLQLHREKVMQLRRRLKESRSMVTNLTSKLEAANERNRMLEEWQRNMLLHPLPFPPPFVGPQPTGMNPHMHAPMLPFPPSTAFPPLSGSNDSYITSTHPLAASSANANDSGVHATFHTPTQPSQSHPHSHGPTPPSLRSVVSPRHFSRITLLQHQRRQSPLFTIKHTSGAMNGLNAAAVDDSLSQISRITPMTMQPHPPNAMQTTPEHRVNDRSVAAHIATRSSPPAIATPFIFFPSSGITSTPPQTNRTCGRNMATS